MSLENLKALREVGRTLLDEPRTNTLGFGEWDCGTFACFAGHYERAHRVGLIAGNSIGIQNTILEHFGLSEKQATDLFGCFHSSHFGPGREAYRELERRMVILDRIIAQREMPESVREIFEAEVEAVA